MSETSKSDRAEADSQEPSMEDILSSIRRILSEESDGDQPPAAAPGGGDRSAAAPEQPAAGTDGDVSAFPDDLSDEDGPEAFVVDSVGPASVPFEPARSVAGSDNYMDLTPEMRIDRMISKPVAGSSTEVLAQLAKAILDRRDIAVGSRDVTLESMVREMLRPLLREWLDRNLPYLIERLVRKEIDSMINRAERLEE